MYRYWQREALEHGSSGVDENRWGVDQGCWWGKARSWRDYKDYSEFEACREVSVLVSTFAFAIWV
jgi:hypothetical protein